MERFRVRIEWVRRNHKQVLILAPLKIAKSLNFLSHLFCHIEHYGFFSFNPLLNAWDEENASLLSIPFKVVAECDSVMVCYCDSIISKLCHPAYKLFWRICKSMD